MENSLPITLSRLTALRRSMSSVANNMANATTTGFRGEQTLFQEYLDQVGTPGSRESVSMTQDIGTVRNFSEGPLSSTGNPLDMALKGDGFFVIGHPAQDMYTRAGSFQMNTDRQIVTSDGYAVLGDNNQPIQIPQDASEITIDSKGVVSARIGGQGQQIGQLQIVRFGDNQQLRAAGSSLFSTDQTPLPTEEAQVVQGFLEGSNVQPINEVTHMIEIMRDYQSVQKMLETEDQRMRDAATKLVRNV